jgi:hypothetical protein
MYLMLLFSVFGGNVIGGSVRIPRPFKATKVEPVPYPHSGGSVELHITVFPDCECTEVTIHVEQLDNLQITSKESTTIRIHPRVEFEHVFSLVIPDADTSGVHFVIEGCDLIPTFCRSYFEVRSDTVVFYENANPRGFWVTRFLRQREERLRLNENKPVDSTWIKSHLLTEARTEITRGDMTTYDPDTVSVDSHPRLFTQNAV